MTRFFVPGSHPALSLAELAAVLATGDFSRCTDGVFLVETDRGAEELQARLGGVVKIGRVVGELPRYNVAAAADVLVDLARRTSEASEGKISFGLSVYDAGNKSMTAQLKKDRQRVGLEMKKRLKVTASFQEGAVGSPRSVRYVDSKEPNLSAVIVTENGLLESGGEYCLMAAPTRVYVGRTETVQDYKEWSRRDYGRPASDAISGMLPPKLARMMVNMSMTPSGGRISPLQGQGEMSRTSETEGVSLLDPFCGSGTVLVEAGLLGFDRLIGNDLEAKAVADTKKNVAWAGLEADIIQGDAANIAERVRGPVDAVVTEPYLGPPRLKKPTPKEAGLTVGTLMTLYERSFMSIHSLLAEGGRCVVAFPVFETTEHRLFLPLAPMLKKIGYKIVVPVPDTAPIAFKERTPNGGLLYRRPDAIVSREILVVEK